VSPNTDHVIDTTSNEFQEQKRSYFHHEEFDKQTGNGMPGESFHLPLARNMMRSAVEYIVEPSPPAEVTKPGQTVSATT